MGMQNAECGMREVQSPKSKVSGLRSKVDGSGMVHPLENWLGLLLICVLLGPCAVAYLPEARLPETGRGASGHKGDNWY
jgi:hypothetical protein